MKLPRLLIVVTAFAIAMGYLESAVVVYLREILYPGGFDFPLSTMPVNLGLTELLRELATLVMLVSIGVLAGKRFSTGFAWFIYSFAIWDIFYYVFLWLLLGWPPSLMTWDILFLIPTTWTGPVLSPVLVSLSMILLALVILLKAERGQESRIPGKIWLGLILGSLILIFGFILDYSQHMLTHFSLFEMMQLKNPEVMEVATSYIPRQFPWGIFGAGQMVILSSIGWYWKMGSKKAMES
jgi:hypothetical protein